jgi:Flp pilus assembly pilin Flp
MSRWRGEAGANAVEFALLLPVLIILLFGTMYGGSLFNSQQTITQAAREGARFGATLPGAEVPLPAEWADQVRDRALGVLDVDRPLTPGAVSVCVRFYDGSGGVGEQATGPEPCPAPSTGPDGARVEVTTTRDARLELGVASLGPITMRGSAVARYEAGP